MPTPFRFKQGEHVRVLSTPLNNAPRGVYRIVRQLPSDGEVNLYRVKSDLEQFERVIPESTLKRLD